jgi:hypothetical protein
MKNFLITIFIILGATTIKAQAWSDWNKLGAGEVYCRIQKVPMPNSNVYFEINIEYKINGDWIRSKSDENTTINCANANFLESNGSPRKTEFETYIKKEPVKDYYFFRGKISMQDSRTKIFKARLVIKPLWKDAIIYETKIPV